jgi:hypothetical protein
MWLCSCSSSSSSSSRLSLLWRLCWFPLRPFSSRGGAKRSRHHRLRHRPADQTMVPPVVSPPHPRRLEGQRLRMSRPWREVKSRRGAPKRVNSEGYACPNQGCPYSGITDAHVHALVGDGTHGHVERIQTFRDPACHTTFTARRNTPFSRLKTPSQQIAVVRISRWPKGWIPQRLGGFSAFDKPLSPAFLSRADSHAQPLHERFFCHLQLPHLQVDERRTRLRCANQVLWLWLAIDPCTRASSRARARSPYTTHGTEGHPLPAPDPGRLSAFRSSLVIVSISIFMRLSAHFGHWLEVRCRGRKSRQWQVAAELIYGQVKKSSRGRKLVRVTPVMRLGTRADLKIAGP